MRDYSDILNRFINDGTGEYIITDTEWNIVYKTGDIDIDDNKWSVWNRPYREDATDGLSLNWEVADKSSGQYYSVHSRDIVDEGVHFLVHHIYDISDFAGLFHDMTSYSREWHMLSTCQSDLIGALSDDCRDVLPIALKYLKTECAVLYIERSDHVECAVMKKHDERYEATRIAPDAFKYSKEAGEVCELPGLEGTYVCCAGGKTVWDDEYGLYILREGGNDDDLMYELYFNVFKLYIENALLRERIIYEYEHDAMTGLYNNGKFNDLLKNEFPTYDCISVFYLDLNYLKRTNDTLGHEAGSRLIVKSANAIKAVCDENTYGFRTGGDEFAIIAKDADDKKALSIYENWKAALNRLNVEDTELECIVACGYATAAAPYDLKTVLDRAESLMYEDKRNIKISRGELPDSR